MDHRFALMVDQRLFDQFLVANVALDADRLGLEQLRQPIEHFRRGVVEIVEDHRCMAGFAQRDIGVRTDIACATRDQDFHRV